VKQVSQTYLLSLTSQEFEQVTLAIMLHSNKTLKLQGFGQCIARWLHQWNTGELRMTEPGHAQAVDVLAGCTHQIYVGLAGDTIQLFKAWRTALVEASAVPVPVKAAIMALVACFLTQHRQETA
jgi:hypothetical protein